jgi:hypothetical protein
MTAVIGAPAVQPTTTLVTSSTAVSMAAPTDSTRLAR